MSTRKTPHTGPGHAAGDPGWCEGCAAERETPTGTNESELREQVARAIHAAAERPESICRTGETDWDLLDSDAAEEYRAEAAAVLPIVAVEARKAKAEALREAAENVDVEALADAWTRGAVTRPSVTNAVAEVQVSLRNLATEYETGDPDEHR